MTLKKRAALTIVRVFARAGLLGRPDDDWGDADE